MSSRSTGFRWLLTAWLIAALSDGVFAHFVVPPPIAAGALLDPVPIKPSGTATWDKLAGEAEAEFAAKNYDAAVVKIRGLLAVAGDDGTTTPLEPLYFKLGLVNLLNGKYPEAEAAFNDCIKRFPKGEYTSRAFLGLGRACMKIDDPQIRWRAIVALKTAAQDPHCRPEAILWLGEVYADFRKTEEALAVYRGYIGKEVRTFQQAAAAVALIGLLADQGRMDELNVELGNLTRQVGVRDSIAWFANEMIVRGEEMLADESFESALIIYRSIPPRREILEIQTGALKAMRKKLAALESKHGDTLQLLSNLKAAIDNAEICMKAVEEKTDLDAALLMRRGRCLFYLDRFEEALLCFRTILSKYPDATDGESAAYAELVILHKLEDFAGIKERFDQFQQKYPQSDKGEQAAGLAVDSMMRNGRWKDVAASYREMEAKFPRSDDLDRYVAIQGLAYFEDADFKQAIPQLERFLATFPQSQLVERASHHLAESYFLNHQFQEALKAASAYLEKFPNGMFAGEMHHRISFIEFNDKNADHSEKIIRDLGDFLATHPDDIAKGSMLCLLADTYMRKGESDRAIECYKKALWTDSSDEVIQHALDSATQLLKARDDWAAVAGLHETFLKRRDESPLALRSVVELARIKTRDGKPEEAFEILVKAFRAHHSTPGKQVELIIDEIVGTLIPKNTEQEPDFDTLDKQLVELFEKIRAGKTSPITLLRVRYARVRLAQMLKHEDRADELLGNIALIGLKIPSELSPVMLASCGGLLLKRGNLDGAEVMFKQLRDMLPRTASTDAGLIGLGNVELARKNPEAALAIFEKALSQPSSTQFKEATLGKLQALLETDRLDEAMKLGLQSAEDTSFQGESNARIYLILGNVCEKKAGASAGDEAKAFLDQALGFYQRVRAAYASYPELCAEAARRIVEVKKKL